MGLYHIQVPLGTTPTSREPFGPTTDSEEPIGVTSDSEEPIGATSDSKEPLGATTDSEEPIGGYISFKGTPWGYTRFRCPLGLHQIQLVTTVADVTKAELIDSLRVTYPEAIMPDSAKSFQK